MNNYKLIKDDIRKYLKNTQNFDAVICTTNKIVKSNGELVMSAGIAKVFAEEFPFLPSLWGMVEQTRAKQNIISKTIITRISGEFPLLIALPTKYHFKDKSDINLITSGLGELFYYSGLKRILLPKPGCLNGGLDWETEVLPKISNFLDSRYTIIEK